jgi:hypothetical protein
MMEGLRHSRDVQADRCNGLGHRLRWLPNVLPVTRWGPRWLAGALAVAIGLGLCARRVFVCGGTNRHGTVPRSKVAKIDFP